MVVCYNQYMGNPSLRSAALLIPLLICVLGACDTLCAKSLADVVRPLLPAGWELTEKNDQIILVRAEKIGLYNGISLPRFTSDEEKRAYVKPHVRYEQLVIKLWLGKRVDPAEFKRIQKNNDSAVERARSDRNDGKFMPDGEFFKKHPEYGYLDNPLPILDTGTQSVYMECPSLAIARPTSGLRPNGRFRAYFDKEVELECQGVIDALGKIYTPY